MWTAADIADVPPIDFREGPIPALEPYRQPVLASEQVRYVGEPVAAVFAHDPYIAEDAADLVTMEVEELPALLAADAEPGEFSSGPQHRSRRVPPGLRRRRRGVHIGACIVVELELAIGRHSGVPLETRGAHRPLRRLARHSGAARRRQSAAPQPGAARAHARSPPSSIHVHESHVGGGFGIRGELYPEDVLVCVAAMRLRPAGEMDRGPARASDRRQSFAPAAPSRPRRRATATGDILAIDDVISTTRAPMCAPTPRASRI